MSTAVDAPRMTYTVDCQDPGRHIYHLTLDLAGIAPGHHRVDLPVWTPGSYDIENYSRHVFAMQAFDQTGRPLAIEKTSKATWEFDTPTAGASLHYSVYAFELSVSGSHLDDTHAYWNGANLFFYADGVKDQPIDVHIQAPPGWYASTGLPADPDDPMHLVADTFDTLVDSPVEVGTHRRYTFRVDDKLHTVALWGTGNQDDAQLVADTRTIVETQAAMFGGLPYRDYTFIFHISGRGTGGLEHLNSTTCGFSRTGFKPAKRYRRALSLIAHEFFHLWNVKRIHPDMLGPFDYSQEVYTHLLWAMEGFTDYYAYLSLRRAGLYTVKDYLTAIADDLKSYERRPGRWVMSLEQSSFDTWMQEYRPDADSPNRAISYYLKGGLVGLALDLEIRRRTHNQRTLDDVLRLLFERYGRHGQGFPEPVYQATAEEVAGSSLADFFGRYIRGVAEVPFDELLATAGLTVERITKNPDRHTDDEAGDADEDATGDPPLAWLGIETRTEGTQVLVATAYDPGPAAGVLYAGDTLLALNGFRVDDAEAWATRIRVDHAPGDTVDITMFRRGELIHRPVTLAAAPPNEYKLVRVKTPTPEQQATYAAWLAAEWPASDPAK